MRLPVIAKVLGLLMMLFSLTMLPPLGISLLYDDGQWQRFSNGLLMVMIGGLVVWLPFRKVAGTCGYAMAS